MASQTAAWTLTGQRGISSLKFVENHPLPALGHHDVRVRIHAASLNYRGIAIALGKFGLTIKDNIVPASDGAGVVEAVGSQVCNLKPGDKVCTHMTTHMADDTPATFADIGAGLGQHVDGTLQSHGIYHETSVVKMPDNLSFEEAATLTCSGLTAWNALFGLKGREPKKGSFALASGATVIATTSNDDKASKFKSLGAHHVINYKSTPDWGTTAKGFTLGGQGVDLIVDVGGAFTLHQSLKAIRPEGGIALAGLLGGASNPDMPSLMDGLSYLCTSRGLLLGTRVQFQAMNHFIEENGIRPLIDEEVFGLHEVREAYEHLEQQKHFSKVVVKIC
ncbi:GroES-like protein [Aspergillus pseudonomiae]|uniref:GroES-like protein n=1 Tax=Aspergillus pseudonomiae TaxID=1506151 RepID=A0A5N7CUJ5_9EURO|nr:GroES-like protein [Aspergillus pseudonomiae]KAE8397876.1 GroES-like protein [Aspergillus pseudonomiae]